MRFTIAVTPDRAIVSFYSDVTEPLGQTVSCLKTKGPKDAELSSKQNYRVWYIYCYYSQLLARANAGQKLKFAARRSRHFAACSSYFWEQTLNLCEPKSGHKSGLQSLIRNREVEMPKHCIFDIFETRKNVI